MDAHLFLMLADFFAPEEVRWKAQTKPNAQGRVLAVAYLDARAIMDRLDKVLGVHNWQDSYEFLPGGSVLCKLSIRFGEEWIQKCDVGSPSEQPDEGDRVKAAVSDGLKRAAVKFGLGRYLYRVPGVWVGYDQQRRTLAQRPTLPAWALPKGAKATTPEPEPKPDAVSNPEDTVSQGTEPATAPSRLPQTGAELKTRLESWDAKRAKQGAWKPGDLVEHVREAMKQQGYGGDLATLGKRAILLACDAARAFEEQARSQQPA